jgi:hypothetical protein
LKPCDKLKPCDRVARSREDRATVTVPAAGGSVDGRLFLLEDIGVVQ